MLGVIGVIPVEDSSDPGAHGGNMDTVDVKAGSVFHVRAQRDGEITCTGLEIDAVAHRVHADGEEIHLTPIEFDLLSVLARNRGRLMTHRALLSEVWGAAYADDTATLRTHIANLRRKIESPGGERRYIHTDAGVGYRFAL